jgi:hypothetical protein
VVLREHAIDDELGTHRSATRRATIASREMRLSPAIRIDSARAPLLWPRIVYDPRMRLYDSEFPVVASVTAAARRARDGEPRHVGASGTHDSRGATRRNPLRLINSYLRGLY